VSVILYLFRCRIRPLNRKRTLWDICSHLHHVFEFARQRELVDKNPFKAPPSRCERHISRPYTADEDAKWEDAARCSQRPAQLFPSSDEWLPYWLLRWTGFRPWDAITVTWQEFSSERREIEHVCHKDEEQLVRNAVLTKGRGSQCSLQVPQQL
jgi:hypothetical protein